jgi:hypothetical protein
MPKNTCFCFLLLLFFSNCGLDASYLNILNFISAGLNSSLLQSYTEDSAEFKTKHHYPFPEDHIAPVSPHDRLLKLILTYTLSSGHYYLYIVIKYRSVLLIPGQKLNAIKGLEYHLNTGDALPVYKHPYQKRPTELLAIKNDIERMLKLEIIQTSKSEWGAPC